MRQKQLVETAPTLSEPKRIHFDRLNSEAKLLEKEINKLVSSFEKRNNLSCYPVNGKKNNIELIITADLNTL